MHLPTTSDAAPASESPTPGQPGTSTRYGLPLEVFQHAWTIAQVQSYLQIGRTQAYALATDPTFPPRLRTGRSHRWNGVQVMAWLHHEDWRTADQPTPASSHAHHLDPASAPARALGGPPSIVDGVPAPSPRRASTHPSRTAETAGTVQPAGPVVRRVIDPARVQREHHAARVAELVSQAAGPASPHPTPHPRRTTP